MQDLAVKILECDSGKGGIWVILLRISSILVVPPVEWVNKHLNEILRWLSLDLSAHWKVEALIGTDWELVTPHLWASSIPVVSLLELSKTLFHSVD